MDTDHQPCVAGHSRTGSTWYVKTHPSERFHQREVTAYREWTPALGHRASRLVAADPGHMAVVVTARCPAAPWSARS
jgi:hypothetical protein